ncbi:MAG: hypothetical protein P8016_14195 [Sedimentisphaerales bacterium]
MKKRKISDLLKAAAEYGLGIQAEDGSFPHGCNGPYHDPETPVRNTAHWLYLLASIYKRTGKMQLKAAGIKAIKYLLSSQARPYGKTFYCRNKSGKDRCNGLVGQAWVIEALVMAADAFDRQECYSLAEEVYFLHPWDGTLGLWKCVDIDGSLLSYDGTFNHQLWFAAASSQMLNTAHVKNRALLFLEKVAAQVQLFSNGVIFQTSNLGKLSDYAATGIQLLLREVRHRIRNRGISGRFYLKSVGYHGFNLYAFAILKKTCPEAGIWQSSTFKSLLSAHQKEDFILSLKESEFSYKYNLSGVEIGYAIETFYQNKEDVVVWLKRQIDQTYLNDAQPFSRGVHDPETADARTYELVRFCGDYEVPFGQ